MKLTYLGYVQHIVGRVLGPDRFGGIYEALSAEYHTEADTTIVQVGVLLRNDPRSTYADEHGQLWIIDPG